MNPLITIIVPVFEVEKYLDRCVESIINQTYKNIEIILINDGSPDRCPEMCDEWAKKDKRIKVIHKKNSGVSDSRNLGLSLAKGEFITFVDSDDFIDVNHIKNLVDCVGDNTELIISGYNQVLEDGSILKNIPELNSIHINELNSNQLLYLFTGNFLFPVWNKLYSKRLIKSNFKLGRKIGEDAIFNFDYLDNVKNEIGFSKNTTYNYIIHNQSAMNKKRDDLFSENIFLIQRFKDYLLEKYGDYKFSEFFIFIHNIVLLSLMKCTDKNRANIINSIKKSEQIKDYKKYYKPKSFKNKIKKFLIKIGAFNLLLRLNKDAEKRAQNKNEKLITSDNQ